MRATPSGRIGAMENPQFPATTVVTPWKEDGVNDGVPEDLGVVVGVDVDEPGGDNLSGGIEGTATGQARAYVGDAPVRDGDVGRPAPATPSRRSPFHRE